MPPGQVTYVVIQGTLQHSRSRGTWHLWDKRPTFHVNGRQ